MALSPTAGLWLGFLLSLMIFSLIIRDNLLARLAQYILVGASTGYLLVLVIQDILRPKLFEPLITSGAIAIDLVVPLLLGLGLVLTGLNGTIRQGNKAVGRGKSPLDSTQTTIPSTPVRSLVTGIGRIALMIIIGVGTANAITGTIQGTLLPQFWQATRIRSSLDITAAGGGVDAASDPTGIAVAAAVALFITIGTILHLYVMSNGDVKTGGVTNRGIETGGLKTGSIDTGGVKTSSTINGDAKSHTLQPSTNATVDTVTDGQGASIAGGVKNNLLLQAWAAIGKRALWFVAGVLFARLAASRLSLLIARIEYLVQTLETTTIWNEFIQLIQRLF